MMRVRAFLAVALLVSLPSSFHIAHAQSGDADAQSKDSEGGTDSKESGTDEGTDSAEAGDKGAASEQSENTAGEDAPGDAASEGADAAAQSGTSSSTTSGVNKGARVGAGSYAVRLRDLERQVGQLKEQVFRSKARLALVSENVLQGAVAGSAVRLRHINRMSSAYRLAKVIYLLDGAPVFERGSNRGSLDDKREFDIYNGTVVPGEHTLTVVLEYLGRGYGVFSYMKGYKFKVRATHTFSAEENNGKFIKVVGYEKGGPTVPVQDRPAVRFAEEDAKGTSKKEGDSGFKKSVRASTSK